MTTSVDFIIIGQGLAGTTLAWMLRQRGRSVLVIDRDTPHSSSRIAAGLMTPVTGARMARSWQWEALYPQAVAYYRSIEQQVGDSFLYQQPALRVFLDEAEHLAFERRFEMLAGMVQRHTKSPNPGYLAPFGAFDLLAAARLDTVRYLDGSRQAFQPDGFRVAEIDFDHDLDFTPDRVQLPKWELEADTLICCGGYTRSASTQYGNLRFNPAKGEILTVHIPDLRVDQVIHRGIWLYPVGHQHYQIGSTYSRVDLTPHPTAVGRMEIESRLRAFLRVPYQVLDHRAAVRPVIDVMHPVFGRHPRFPRLAFFNGLGSKGALLAPAFAEKFANDLLNNRPGEFETDVKLFLI